MRDVDATALKGCARLVRTAGLGEPNVLQRRAWALCLAGKDVLIVAPTGSGKTLAAVAPLPSLLAGSSTATTPETSDGSVRAVFLVPTRELAAQVARACAPLATEGVAVAAVHGGESFGAQMESAKRAALVVATPGRLLDLLGEQERRETARPSSSLLSLLRVSYVVIDEADKMLQMGLRAQVEAVLARVAERRQVVLTTATATAALRSLSSTLQRDACTAGCEAAAEEEEEEGAERAAAEATPRLVESMPIVPRSIRQSVWVVAEHKKRRRLLRLLGSLGGERALLFANSKSRVVSLGRLLAKHAFRVGSLVGSMPQRERTATLDAFRAGSLQLLVATDVAARGLHIDGLRNVLCYDAGSNLEQCPYLPLSPPIPPYLQPRAVPIPPPISP
eukprot:CAMPEP_0185476756 /NCGR_PEP_ID=MMETSP1366-20130426/3522_1 /TAXON_ID=38817 /ORGANISM="Gephyrocapsa oceanica, Strain RCC1303" /LENGTH=391 /DNA_ID=CAMNT_0028083827 /DNA_START=152 /DNA_END=1324 /DNA_ORIENTATION=-